jgi:hypothetical protein
MSLRKSPQKWSRISLSTDGKDVAVRYSDLTVRDLTNLFYAALEKIPHTPAAMQLALEKYNKKHKNADGKTSS